MVGDRAWQRLKGDIIRVAIGVKEPWDSVAKEVIPIIAVKTKKGKWKCLICNKLYDSERAIFYHVAYIHQDFIEELALRYRFKKLKLLGLEVLESDFPA